MCSSDLGHLQKLLVAGKALTECLAVVDVLDHVEFTPRFSYFRRKNVPFLPFFHLSGCLFSSFQTKDDFDTPGRVVALLPLPLAFSTGL